MLSADFQGKATLLRQLDGLQVRRIDEDGSLELAQNNKAPAATIERRIPVEAELTDRDGVTIHLLLHVLDGFMKELEVYREDSAPRQRPLTTDDFRLIAY